MTEQTTTPLAATIRLLIEEDLDLQLLSVSEECFAQYTIIIVYNKYSVGELPNLNQ